MQRFRFTQQERLKNRKRIDLLFNKGKSAFKFPIKAVWNEDGHAIEKGLKAGFSVPKRKIKKAVLRNRIKRQLREVWRVRKHRLLAEMRSDNQLVEVLFIFVADEEVSMARLEYSMDHLLRELVHGISK